MADEILTRRRVLTGAGIAGAVGLAAAVPMVALGSGVAGAENDRNEGADAIEGAWRGTGSLNLGGSLTFAILFTFAAGGGAVSSGSIDLAPEFLSTPAYGAWKRTGPGRYAVNFFFFTFDSKGNPSGIGQVKSDDTTVDDDRLKVSATITFFDQNNHPVANAPIHVDATRIEADD